ncbi:unnamed protein product [Closterium sp. NIES-65]|nr:unnamed protein product [Closterium sp. NIES-65]
MPQISPELAEAAKRLHESSTKVYNLADDTTRSPSPLSFPPDVPPAPHLEGCTANTGLYFILTPSHSSPPLPTPPHPSASLPTPSHLSTVLDQAPHLEDCTAKTALRVKAEARGAHGEDPEWVLQLHAPTPLDECFGAAVLLLEDRAQCTVQTAREDPEWVLLCYLASAATAHEFRVDSKLDVSHTAGGSSPVHSASSKDPRVGAVLLGKASAATAQRTPQPPRIRGSDAANLALTRVFQRDLWERQFPASCAGRRLMITDWPPKHHGTGNMVHVMGSFLNAAVRHNRTLVIRPRTFHRASGQDTGNMVHVMGSFLNAAVRHNRTLVIRPRTFHSASGQECAGRSLSAPTPSTVLAGRSAQVCSPKHSYPTHHGTGNMVHVMGSFLNAAVRHNRTLVIRPRTFHRSSRQAGVCRTGGEYKEGNGCAVLCSAKGRSSSALAPSTAPVGGNVGWMGTGQVGSIRKGMAVLCCAAQKDARHPPSHLPLRQWAEMHWQEGEWECYFFPVASPDCLKVALAALTAVTPIALFPYPTEGEWECYFFPVASPDCLKEGEWECYFFPVAYPDCLKVAPSLLSCLSYCPPMCPPYPHPPDIGQEGEWECYFFPVAYPDCLKVAPSLLSCLSYCPPMCPPYPHPPDIGQEGEWECYFFPVASPDCLKVALAAEATAPIALFNDTKETVLASAAQVVICNDTHYHHDAARAASLWVAPDGRPPELEHPFTIEQLGRIWVPNDNHIGERWWRSQTARFLLRWPSALLCHITNRVRHNTYGMAVAERVISATAKQQTILHSTPPNTPESQHLNSLPDASSAVPPSVAYKSSLAGTVWQMKGFAGCVGTRCNESEACAGAGSANAGGGAAVEFSSLQDEPFIFRPYVSLHVRLSDKYLEMKLHFFATYMYFMYKLRAHVPNLEHVWLSTEMQSVIEETSNFPDWTFHYTTSGRVTSATQMQEEHVKDKQRTGEIFANLIITTQADYFVGALASNWNRLIDELRSTNGRLYSGHVALNEAWT